MGISVLGPTFEDLASNVKKDISNISYIFVGRSAGYIGGSLLGGVLFDCLNPNLLLGKPPPPLTCRSQRRHGFPKAHFVGLAGFSMLITSCGMCAIPFCKHALLLTGFMSSIGISMGILDTGRTTAAKLQAIFHNTMMIILVLYATEPWVCLSESTGTGVLLT